jgi:hypothetical protein
MIVLEEIGHRSNENSSGFVEQSKEAGKGSEGKKSRKRKRPGAVSTPPGLSRFIS